MAGLGKGNNACSVLNSYHQGCKYELLGECGPPHIKEFTFAVEVLGQQFVGKGRSKKLAKQAAAASALKTLYSINLSLGVESVPMAAMPMSTGGWLLKFNIFICMLYVCVCMSVQLWCVQCSCTYRYKQKCQIFSLLLIFFYRSQLTSLILGGKLQLDIFS